MTLIHWIVFYPPFEQLGPVFHRAPVAQLVEHRGAMLEVVSLTLAGPTPTLRP